MFEKLVASSSDKPQGPQKPLENKLEEIRGGKPQTHRFLSFSCAILPRICIFTKLPESDTTEATWQQQEQVLPMVRLGIPWSSVS